MLAAVTTKTKLYGEVRGEYKEGENQDVAWFLEEVPMDQSNHYVNFPD
jgi:hypothetical protein